MSFTFVVQYLVNRMYVYVYIYAIH